VDKIGLIPYAIKEIPEGVKMVKAPEVWDDSQTRQGVLVAIIDTSCQKKHSDLQGRMIAGKNFSDDGTPDDFSDNKGHGVHVARTVAAVINKAEVTGVAVKASLLILKVFDKDSYAQNEERVRVINIFLGSPYHNQHLHMAFQ